MMDYINPPELRPWTEDDIRREFARIGNRRKAAKIYDIPLREVNQILRSGVCQETECPYNQGDPCPAGNGCAVDRQKQRCNER